jgi:hypothetical protein
MPVARIVNRVLPVCEEDAYVEIPWLLVVGSACFLMGFLIGRVDKPWKT